MTAPQPADLREFLSAPAVSIGPRLLGATLTLGEVSLRLTEVEAYQGADDPGSHAFRGPTPRTASMFGEAGHLYVYFTYGMHYCCNLVCGRAGEASALLLRAGEITTGIEIARARRPSARSDAELARGPGRLTRALGIGKEYDGFDLLAVGGLQLAPQQAPVVTTLRTGVSGPGGGDAFPWRFAIPDDRTVSPYRAHVPKPTPTRSPQT